MLRQSNPFSFCDATDGSELKLFNLVTKIILPEDIQHDILDTTDRGERALSQFVQDRLNGEKNMWNKMPQIKCKTWSDGCKKVKLKTRSEEITLKASNSLFMHLLIIAKSSRELDLEEVIGNYEFSDINSTLMKADGSLHPCLDKSKLIHILKDLAPDNSTVAFPATHSAFRWE